MTLDQISKLKAMFANPPNDSMRKQGHASIAWCIDLITPASGGQPVGFLMMKVTGMSPIFDFYNPISRREQAPLFNYLYLHRAARNLASAVRSIHECGYTIGDVNESNILLADAALVTLVDTDSFQVWDGKTLHRCPVGKPEFTPPELQGKVFKQVDRTPEHDLFGLAVIIFKLLMEGNHPFDAVFTGQGEVPPIEARIQAGHFLYGTKTVPYRPKPLAPAFEVLCPSLQQLFQRCFETGHINPSARPTAKEWQNLLDEAERALIACSHNGEHRYGNHLTVCPWCKRTQLLGGRDPFPSIEAVRLGNNLQPNQLTPKIKPAQIPLPSSSAQLSPQTKPGSNQTQLQKTLPSIPAQPPLQAKPAQTQPQKTLSSQANHPAQPQLSTRRNLLKWLSFGGAGVAIAAFTNEQFKPRGSSSSSIPPTSTPAPASFPKNAVITVNAEGQEVKRRFIQPKSYKEDLGNGIMLEVVEIPGGKFLMGSPKLEPHHQSNERPQHEITVASFQMGKFEVTQEQWQAVAALPKVNLDLNSNPSGFTRFKGANRPVETVSWNDAIEFCARLSRKTGKQYRLPSEAEWEYACRAGTTTTFHCGEALTTDLANFRYPSGLRDDELYPEDSIVRGVGRDQTTDVGSFPPNGFGLCDMHGNVRELCADLLENDKQAPFYKSCIVRGGGWYDDLWGCRSAIREYWTRGQGSYDIGFRVALSFPKTP